jgi:hypothetical protein
MDELIKTVTEKAGINPEQAKVAVSSVLEFVKGKFPKLGEQVQGLITGNAEGGNPLTGAVDALKKKFGA